MLWDVDGTLLNAGGVGHDLYDVVFLQLFGRSLEAFAPMAGRVMKEYVALPESLIRDREKLCAWVGKALVHGESLEPKAAKAKAPKAKAAKAKTKRKK